jgi:hypothetical protein
LRLRRGFYDGKSLTGLPDDTLSPRRLGSNGTRGFLSFARLLLRVKSLCLQRPGDLIRFLDVPSRLLQPELTQAGLGGRLYAGYRDACH